MRVLLQCRGWLYRRIACALVNCGWPTGVGLGWEKVVEALEGVLCALDCLSGVFLNLQGPGCVCVRWCLDVWSLGGCVARTWWRSVWFNRIRVRAFAGWVMPVERVRY